MKKNRKIFDRKFSEEIDLTYSQFVKEVRENPLSIYENPKIKEALLLMYNTLIDKSVVSPTLDFENKFVLKDAGLSAFIPKDSKGRKSNSRDLIYFKSFPEELNSLVGEFSEVINKHLKKRYLQEGGADSKNEDIRRAADEIIEKLGYSFEIKARLILREPPKKNSKGLTIYYYSRKEDNPLYSNTKVTLDKDIIEEITSVKNKDGEFVSESETTSTNTNIALSLIAWIYEIPFYALRKLYYSKKASTLR